MIREFILAAAMAGLVSAPALADQIEGRWRTGEGGNVSIAGCGSSFCIKVTSGEFNGRQIGKLKKDGDKYVGKITDPANDRTYRGSAWFSGANTLNMRGSVLGGLVGRTDKWTRR
ncbi:DUF2147 domain-containing protein [Oricola sp.]|uniref:DUF2147 domain-containing protein n=1 Tax=Oricola sp. TaxID=1979950 RepID=UPI003BAC1EA5